MRRSLSVTRFLLTTILLSISLPALVTAAPAPAAVDHGLQLRHEDDQGMDMDMEVDMGHTHPAEESSEDDVTPIASTSSISMDMPAPVPTHSHASADPLAHSHNHGSHTAPKETLDDQAIHEWHSFPPTYLAADFRLDNDSAIFGEEFDQEWEPETAGGHRGLMVAHVGAMCVAYFGALPISLALRAANHPSHHLGNLVFLIIGALGWLAGTAYAASTPNRYEGAVHGGFGNILVLLSLVLSLIDSFGVFKLAYALYRSGHLNWSTFTHDVLRSSSDKWLGSASHYEMVGLVEHEDDEHSDGRQVMFAIGEDDDEDERVSHRSLSRDRAPLRPSLLIRQWTPPSRTSTGSDGTLHDTPPASASSHTYHHKTASSPTGAYYEHHHETEVVWPEPQEKKMDAARVVELLLTWVRRTQVVVAYVVFLTGIVTYTGMCRAGLINTCAAHLIKGSIFFGYGVLTFARYLGAYADLGWAWNRRPDGQGVSAEMIECSVIFVYGITNTWMERFGAKHGDPYTVKQVQHISIAVMFWFAGLSGMLLESRKIRRVLSSVIGRQRDTTEPPSYQFSFNPLPALVIGVTGLAMAAHHQDYVFQVAIHSLWGILLAGGSAFRMLTYAFLFLRPPTESTLPSRPPTEILTAFGWASGGIVFMLSSEEIAFAAMRTGYDDMMAFLNFTIALTSFVFCWEVIVLAVKGYAVMKGESKARLENGEGDEERAQAMTR